MVGFDSVDDESRPETSQLHPERFLPTPEEWTQPDNPPYRQVLIQVSVSSQAKSS